eukprot:m.174625 g.174625  ORF g.174625 m.174625 type:complete len:458 (-) comp24360_c0_seq2:189-1562(-)
MASSSGFVPSFLSLGGAPPRTSRGAPRRETQTQQQATSGGAHATGSAATTAPGLTSGGTYVAPKQRGASLSGSYPPRGSQAAPAQKSRTLEPSSQRGAQKSFDDLFPTLGPGSLPGRSGIGESQRSTTAWSTNTGKSGSPTGHDARAGGSGTESRKKIQMVSRPITNLHSHSHSRRNQPPQSAATAAPRSAGVLDRGAVTGSFGQSTSALRAALNPQAVSGVATPATGRTPAAAVENRLASGTRASTGSLRSADSRSGSGDSGSLLRAKSSPADELARATQQSAAAAPLAKRTDEATRKRAAKKSIADLGFMEFPTTGGEQSSPSEATTEATPPAVAESELQAELQAEVGMSRSQPAASMPIPIAKPRAGHMAGLLPTGSIEKEEALLRQMGWGLDDVGDDSPGLTQEEIDEVRAKLQSTQPKIKPVGLLATTWCKPSSVAPTLSDEIDSDESSDDE